MTRLILATFVFLLCRAPVLADSPASKPTTRPVAADSSTPRGALKEWDQSLGKLRTDTVPSIYHAEKAKERKVVAAMVQADLATAELAALVRKQFGDARGDEALHAMRVYTAADIDNASEKIDGDSATVDWADDREPLEMVKVEGKWRISVADLLGEDDSDEAIAEVIKTNEVMVKELKKTAAELKGGEYSNYVLLERAIKQRVFRVMGEDE